MREIKFRWKDIDWNLVYWCLVRYSDSVSYIASDIIEKPMELVSTDTVWQFTWLLDKNWKEIYTGDIVEFIDWRCSKQQWLYKSSKFDGYVKWFRWVIKWTKHGYFLDKKNKHNDKILEPKKPEREERHNPYIYHNSDIEKKELSVEIIWNIYENPDLLTNK